VRIFAFAIGINQSIGTFRPSTDHVRLTLVKHHEDLELPRSRCRSLDSQGRYRPTRGQFSRLTSVNLLAVLLPVAHICPFAGIILQSIIHINDHHSNLDELNLDLPRSIVPPAVLEGISPNVTTVRTKYGSFPRVVSLIKQLSNQAAAAGWNVLRVHAGDAITGTNYFSFFGYAVDAAVLNLAGFEAMTIGNHEFDRVSPLCSTFVPSTL
jgi:hypothetical protein